MDLIRFLRAKLLYITAGPAYYVLHPQKGIINYLRFFNLPSGLQSREGIVSQTNLAERFRILHLHLQILHGNKQKYE